MSTATLTATIALRPKTNRPLYVCTYFKPPINTLNPFILFFSFPRTPSIISIHFSIYYDNRLSLIPLASDGANNFRSYCTSDNDCRKFKEIWLLVSYIYSHQKTEKGFKGTLKVSQYKCHLRKSQKSSNIRANNPGLGGTNLKRHMAVQIGRPESATSQ
jgi:hypothetical protein